MPLFPSFTVHSTNAFIHTPFIQKRRKPIRSECVCESVRVWVSSTFLARLRAGNGWETRRSLLAHISSPHMCMYACVYTHIHIYLLKKSSECRTNAIYASMTHYWRYERHKSRCCMFNVHTRYTYDVEYIPALCYVCVRYTSATCEIRRNGTQTHTLSHSAWFW